MENDNVTKVRLGFLPKLIAAAVLSQLVFINVVHADEPPSPTQRYRLFGDPNSPDLSGLWSGTFTTTPGQSAQNPIADHKYNRWLPWPLPLTPKYQAAVEARAAAAKTGRVADSGIKCLPTGMPWKIVVNPGLPIEVMQTPGQVSFWGGQRPLVIYTDGRLHPSNLKPTFDGHSIGYWIGNKLYIDTVGILATTSIDAGYHPHSAEIHLKWTVERVAPDRLHATITLLDREAFSEPLVTTIIYEQLHDPMMDLIDDASCFENNRHLSNESDDSGFKRF